MSNANVSKSIVSTSLKVQLEKVFTHLNQGLVERDTEIRLAILAALAGEHLLLLGPPGTAKSELARRLVQVIGEGPAFERLLTRFSVPEELFGPLSLKALEDDRYERRLDGYLPTAQVAFIDEIFKANSAILNSLLTVLNEREYDNGTERLRVPLVALIGASNELPEGEELQALYDRFLVRREVLPVSEAGFMQMLSLSPEDSVQSGEVQKLSAESIEDIQKNAARVLVPQNVIEFLGALRKYLVSEQIYVSDRRWRKAVKLLQVAAYTNGQKEVTIWECKLLEHCLWSTPAERVKISQWYDERIGVSSAKVDGVDRFERMTTALEALLKKDQETRSQAFDENGKPLYFDEYGQPTSEPEEFSKQHARNVDGEFLYYAPEGTEERKNKQNHYTRESLFSMYQGRRESNGWGSSPSERIIVNRNWVDLESYVAQKENQVLLAPDPVMVAQRYSTGHINARKQHVESLLGDIQKHLDALDGELSTLLQRIKSHLWLEASFAEVALNSLRQEYDKADAFKKRLGKVLAGFGKLPQEEDLSAIEALEHEDEEA